MLIADPDDAPVRKPECYPGRIPTFSYLLCADRYARIDPVAGRPVTAASVRDLVAGPAGEPAGGGPPPLDRVLALLGAPPLLGRVPVLCVGSNAAPAQLAVKFGSRGVPGVAPVIRSRVTGLGIAFSAHLSVHGYLPAAPCGIDPAAELRNAHVVFLDPDQLDAVDDTEPNYRRVPLDPSRYRVTLDNGERVDGCRVYRGRHGIVAPGTRALGPFLDATRITAQPEVLAELLARHPALGRRLGVAHPGELTANARAISPIVTRVLAELGIAVPDRLDQ